MESTKGESCEFINLCKVCQKKVGLTCPRSGKELDKKLYMMQYTLNELVEIIDCEIKLGCNQDVWRALKLRIGLK